MKIEEIKKKALENRVPIIMDDTLEKIVELLKEVKPKRLLEHTLTGSGEVMLQQLTLQLVSVTLD